MIWWYMDIGKTINEQLTLGVFVEKVKTEALVFINKIYSFSTPYKIQWIIVDANADDVLTSVDAIRDEYSFLK